VRLAVRPATKDQLDLPVPKRPDKGEFQVINFQAYFLAQFTAQRCFRLFAGIDKPARDAPATAGSKDMFQEQHVALFVSDYGAGADDESRMTKTRQEKANARRRQTKQKCQEVFEHDMEIIIQQCPTNFSLSIESRDLRVWV